MEHCNDDIQRNGFSLPGMFIGISDDANYATAYIVRKLAEEQIFVPARRRFDEIINKTIVKDFGLTDLVFRSNGPALYNIEGIPQVLNLLVNAGAFTVNGLISFVNHHLGIDIALYTEEWADQPIAQAKSQPLPELQENEDALLEEDTDEILNAVEKSKKVGDALDMLSAAIKEYALDPKHSCTSC